MKKILAAIAMLLVAVPFVKANALNETTNYYNYKKGQIVNFYSNKAKEDKHLSEATEVFIVEDKDTSDRFVKVWFLGGYASDQRPVRRMIATGAPYTTFRNYKSDTDRNNPYVASINYLNNDGFETGLQDDAAGNYFYDFDDDAKGLDLLTIAELKAILGEDMVKESETKYTINNKVIVNREEAQVKFYDELEKMIAVMNKTGVEGYTTYWLGDVTSDKKVWALQLTLDANNKITAVTVEPLTYDDTDGATNPARAFAWTMYANKTADCHKEEVKKHCYKCKATEEGKFTWIITTENDSKIETCEIVPDAECNPKTGSKSHLLEFSIVAALCAISLLVVRRKDLFRTI